MKQKISRRSVKVLAGTSSAALALVLPKCFGCVGAYLWIIFGLSWSGRELCSSRLDGSSNPSATTDSVENLGLAVILFILGAAALIVVRRPRWLRPR